MPSGGPSHRRGLFGSRIEIDQNIALAYLRRLLTVSDGLRQIAFDFIQQCKVVQYEGQIGMPSAKPLFNQRGCAMETNLGLIVHLLVKIETAEIIQDGGSLRVCGTK